MMMDTSATIGEYLSALEALKQRQGEMENFYIFHVETPVAKTCIDDNIQCCEDILAGTDDHISVEFLGRTGYLAKERVPGVFQRKDGRREARCSKGYELPAVPRRFVRGKRVIPVVQQTGQTPQFLILAKMTGQSPHHGLTGQRMLNKVRLRAGFAQKLQCSFTINHGTLP